MINADRLPLFDSRQSQNAQDEGIARATSPLAASRFLAEAQETAEYLARAHGEVTADDVVEAYARRGLNLNLELGNAMGALFKDKATWEWTGKVRNSKRVGRHSGVLRVWKLRG